MEKIDTTPLLNMTVENATVWLAKQGFKLRVVKKDGHACMATRDMRRDRVNVEIEGDVVTGLRGIH